MTRNDLGSPIYSEYAIGIWHCLFQAALGVRMLGKIRGNCHSRIGIMSVAARSFGFGIAGSDHHIRRMG